MKKTFFSLVGIALIASTALIFSCNKEEEKTASNSDHFKKGDFSLVAEMKTDETYERSELLDLGNVYESLWEKRYFENGEFVYDVECMTSDLDTRLTMLACDKDKVSFETEDGDTMTLYNVVSSGNVVTFDMLRDDNSKVHFKFTVGEEIDFMKELQKMFRGGNTKFVVSTIGIVCTIVAAVTSTVAATAAIVSIADSRHNRRCDILKQNYTTVCNSFGCGVWQGDCCVRCLKNNDHPRCSSPVSVYGAGSDCNL